MQEEMAIGQRGGTISGAGSSKSICTIRVIILLFSVVDLTVYGADQ